VSNPHAPCGTQDFKSCASASSATPALADNTEKHAFVSSGDSRVAEFLSTANTAPTMMATPAHQTTVPLTSASRARKIASRCTKAVQPVLIGCRIFRKNLSDRIETGTRSAHEPRGGPHLETI
jgi:hypothetical protein